MFEPTLTYHGFRYVRVSGHLGQITAGQFASIAVSSAGHKTMDFQTSNQDVNQLHSNVQWTMRSNLFSVPTDNPDRERARWTGDLQVIASTAAQCFQIQSFLTRWLHNMVLDQYANRLVPMVIPYFKAYYNLMTTQGFETCAA